MENYFVLVEIFYYGKCQPFPKVVPAVSMALHFENPSLRSAAPVRRWPVTIQCWRNWKCVVLPLGWWPMKGSRMVKMDCQTDGIHCHCCCCQLFPVKWPPHQRQSQWRMQARRLSPNWPLGQWWIWSESSQHFLLPPLRFDEWSAHAMALALVLPHLFVVSSHQSLQGWHLALAKP